MLKVLFPIMVLMVLFLLLNEMLKNKNYKQDSSDSIYPYEKKKYLLSVAEKNFYDVLSLAIQDTEYYICPKVRLADIITVGKTDKRQTYFNKIQSKHIDFLLCDKSSLVPLLAIELDDSSHLKDDRIARDIFVDKSLESAGLNFIRFKVQHAYTVSDIKDKLNIRVPN
ncbi:DUF2726 domain-containing protein [Tissierella carlieri]|uniref:DUF2726 domain-containing protein n=1 Tax=Tissierella carlieri TaxID=689904 RepID=A0ABT1S921_9FIRM|nr:DUF2726 domain-containing protein [Tissierella carlieri]MCQ4922962.1 DUF2726 domain-containing protein [Tissierella carlieri]